MPLWLKRKSVNYITTYAKDSWKQRNRKMLRTESSSVMKTSRQVVFDNNNFQAIFVPLYIGVIAEKEWF